MKPYLKRGTGKGVNHADDSLVISSKRSLSKEYALTLTAVLPLAAKARLTRRLALYGLNPTDGSASSQVKLLVYS